MQTDEIQHKHVLLNGIKTTPVIQGKPTRRSSCVSPRPAAEGRDVHQPARGGLRLRVLGALRHRERGHQRGAGHAAVPGRADAGDGLPHGGGPGRPRQVRRTRARTGSLFGSRAVWLACVDLFTNFTNAEGFVLFMRTSNHTCHIFGLLGGYTMPTTS